LNVAHSWSAADGLKSPKNGEARRVPLLPDVREALLAQLATTLIRIFPKPGGLFSGDLPRTSPAMTGFLC
jgi:integrase